MHFPIFGISTGIYSEEQKVAAFWDKVFKSGLCKFFKGCLPQNLLSPLLNTLSHLFKMQENM